MMSIRTARAHPAATHRVCVVHAARVCLLVVLAAAAGCGDAAPAEEGDLSPAEPACTIDWAPFIHRAAGALPLVLVGTHTGEARPPVCRADGRLDTARQRSCDDAPATCVSGPCSAGVRDAHARDILFAVAAELERSTGRAPFVVATNVARSFVDLNRDAHDPAGSTCALVDPALLPFWEAFHAAVADAARQATESAEPGELPLVVDIHTYTSLPDAPPPAVMLGTGTPFGFTLPQRGEVDPRFTRVFGVGGMRPLLLSDLERVLDDVAPDADALRVLPPHAESTAKTASLAVGLFRGRYVVHSVSHPVEGTGVDALQIEVSAVLRDSPEATGTAIARALVASLLRSALPPTGVR